METALTWTKWPTLLEFLPVNIEVFVAYTQAKDGDDDVLYYSVAVMMMVVVMTRKMKVTVKIVFVVVMVME